jgi:GT2 family glycosyltransferase
MNVAIACVNYNSYGPLLDFLNSVEEAARYSLELGQSLNACVLIADNSEEKQDVQIDKYKNIKCMVSLCPNLGYLGGAFKVINEIDNRSYYDYIIISNVDVILNKDFFSRLQGINPDGLGWIAPGIFKPQMNKICNFEWQHRPSVRRMKLYSFLFSHPAIYSIYFVMSRLKIKSETNTDMNNREIYAGYGSFMIFTKEFMTIKDKWDYGPFLFGEEIFFGELVRQAKLKVLYVPSLQITDVGKVSTGRMNAIGKLKVQKVSNDYLLKTFFDK